MAQLNLKFIIDSFSKNNELSVSIKKNKYLFESYTKIFIDYPANLISLFTIFLLCDLNIEYELNKKNNRIKINDMILNKEIEKLINFFTKNKKIEIARKKRLLSNLQNNVLSNDIIVLLTEYFNTNLILYINDFDNIKLYYVDEEFDIEKPIIVVNYVKDINSINYGYELIKNTDSYCFSYGHPIIDELIKSKNKICIGVDYDKKFMIRKNIDYTHINELNKSIIQQKNFTLMNISNKNKRLINMILEHYPKNIEYLKQLIYNSTIKKNY
jgi:hypothetical protein